MKERSIASRSPVTNRRLRWRQRRPTARVKVRIRSVKEQNDKLYCFARCVTPSSALSPVSSKASYFKLLTGIIPTHASRCTRVIMLALQTVNQNNSTRQLKPMPISYVFKDSKTSDTVAKALLFVAKYSKKQAFVKFSDSSVSVIWGGNTRSYFTHAEATALDMFKRPNHIRPYGIDHCTIIQVNPTILGKLLRGVTSDRTVTIQVIKPNKLRLCVEYTDSGSSKRTMVHTISCDFKSLDDYKALLVEEIERSVCRYDTKSYVESVPRLRHIIDSFVRLNTAKVYLWSKNSTDGNDLTVQARTQGSNVLVSLSDLEFGNEMMQDINPGHRDEAGVVIDTKKLAAYLAGLVLQKKSKVLFEIEHNKCLKLSSAVENNGEKFYQSLLLLHSLNG